MAAVLLVCAAGAMLRRPAPPMLRDRPVTWSNPQGTALTPISDAIWLAERPFFPRLPGLQGTDVGCKMAVVRLSSGKLWVHSPVALDAGLRDALSELGEVSHIVTPNTEHQKFAASWIMEYPDALSYACPGLRERKPEVGWQRSLSSLLDAPNGVTSLKPPAEWEGEIELCYIKDRVPLTRDLPFFNEVVFLHKPSRALIVTDLYWNYPAQVPTSTRVWKFGMDVIYKPVYNRLMRTSSWGESYSTIMSWDFEAILPAHGDPIDQGGKSALARHLGYDD